MFISIILFNFGEKTQLFQHENETLEEIKAYVVKQFFSNEEGFDRGSDSVLIYEIVPGQRQPRFVCNAHDIPELIPDKTL